MKHIANMVHGQVIRIIKKKETSKNKAGKQTKRKHKKVKKQKNKKNKQKQKQKTNKQTNKQKSKQTQPLLPPPPLQLEKKRKKTKKDKSRILQNITSNIIKLLHLNEINMRFYGAEFNNIERAEAEFNIVVLCSIKLHIDQVQV